MEIATCSHYREILQSSLEERSAKNPKYSLRAFARDIGLSSGRLSQILNGKYGLSKEAAKSICNHLGFNKSESEYFCLLVESQHARSKVCKEAARIRLSKFKRTLIPTELQLHYFKIISDWHHFAILELTHIDGFESNPEWIAKMLGISLNLTKSAISRMIRLKLLDEIDGKLVDTNAFLATPSDVPSNSLKKYHHQLLDKAIASLYTQKINEREFNSTVISIDKEQLPEAKEKIREFRDYFDRYMSNTKKKNSVYCLGIQFFELSEDIS